MTNFLFGEDSTITSGKINLRCKIKKKASIYIELENSVMERLSYELESL